MTAKKFISTIHLWLGLASGLVVFLLGITGAIYVFEKELQDTFYADAIFVDEKKAKPLPFDTLITIAQKVLGVDKPVNRVEIQPGSNRTYIFRAYGSSDAILYANNIIYNNVVHINPYTGKVQYSGSNKWEFFSIVLALHYDLMLGPVGHVIVPWATAIFVIMLITGLILWWPKNKPAARQRFWFRWKTKTGWKRKNYDLHNIPGFYVLIIALFISLTGLVFGFRWFSNTVKYVANAGKEMKVPPPVISDTSSTTVKTIIYQNILAEVQKQQPHLEKFLLVFPEKKAGAISVRCYYNPKNFVKQNTMFFDQHTGAFIVAREYKKLNTGDKVSMAVYDAHVGKILGLPGQIIALLASLISASLPVTGFYIWWNRRKKLNHDNKKDRKVILRNFFADKQES